MIVLVALAAGAALMALLRVRTETPAGAAGSALFIGAIGLALWTHLLLFVRIPVGFASVTAGAALLVAAALGKGDRAVLGRRWRAPGLGALFVAVSAGLAIFWALAVRELEYDPAYFYLLKAKSILHYGTIWNPDFTDPDRLHIAGRRPLLLPCLYADFFLLAPAEDPRLLRLWFALLHVGSLGVLFERARPTPVWLGVYALIPALWHAGGVSTGYADAMLGILLYLGFDALRTGERALSMIALSAAVLLKQDAMAFPIAVALATAIAMPRELPRTAALLAIPAGAGLLYMGLARMLPLTHDFNPGQFSTDNIISSVRHWPYVSRRMASDLIRPAHWGLFWVLGLGALVSWARKLDRFDALWLLAILFQALAYAAVLSTYGEAEVEAATRIQKMRLLLHLAPLFWAWVAFKARSTESASPA